MKDPDYFTNQDLLILDIALTEFMWGLEEELDSWDHDDLTVESDNEYDTTLEMLTDCEELSDCIQELLILEETNV